MKITKNNLFVKKVWTSRKKNIIIHLQIKQQHLVTNLIFLSNDSNQPLQEVIIQKTEKEVFTIFLLCAILVGAVMMDLISYRIKNSYLFLSFSIGLCYCIVTRQAKGLAETIVSLFLVLLCTVPVFALKGIGAADVKLFAVIACFCTPQVILRSMICSLCIASAEGILILFLKFLTTKKFSISKKTHIHFSIPITLSILLHIGGFY